MRSQNLGQYFEQYYQLSQAETTETTSIEMMQDQINEMASKCRSYYTEEPSIEPPGMVSSEQQPTSDDKYKNEQGYISKCLDFILQTLNYGLSSSNQQSQQEKQQLIMQKNRALFIWMLLNSFYKKKGVPPIKLQNVGLDVPSFFRDAADQYSLKQLIDFIYKNFPYAIQPKLSFKDLKANLYDKLKQQQKVNLKWQSKGDQLYKENKNLIQNHYFPFLKIDKHLSIARIEFLLILGIYHKSYDQALQSLLMVDGPCNFERIFQETKALTLSLIQNKSNGVFNFYIDYLVFYKDHYHLDPENKIILEESQVLQSLKKGIDSSKIILLPHQTLYGMTNPTGIYFNLNSFLVNNQRNLKNGAKIKDVQNLIKASICITCLHELSHYILRSLGLANYQSSFFTQQRETFSQEQKKNWKILNFFRQMDSNMFRFIVQNREELKTLSKAIDIEANYQKIQRMQQCLVSYRISQFLKNNLDVKKLKVQQITINRQCEHLKRLKINKQIMDKRRITKTQEKNEQKQKLEDQIENEQLSFWNVIQPCIQDRDQLKKWMESLGQIQVVKSIVSSRLRSKLIEKHPYVFQFLASYEKSLKRTSLKDLQMAIDQNNIQNLKEVEQFKQASEEKRFMVSEIFRSIYAYSQINNQQLGLAKLIVGLPTQLQQKIQYKIDRNMRIITNFSKFISQILEFKDDFLKNSDSKQSGYILEGKLFKSLPKNKKVYLKDYQILKDLTKEKDQFKCLELRSNFSQGEKVDKIYSFLGRMGKPEMFHMDFDFACHRSMRHHLVSSPL